MHSKFKEWIDIYTYTTFYRNLDIAWWRKRVTRRNNALLILALSICKRHLIPSDDWNFRDKHIVYNVLGRSFQGKTFSSSNQGLTNVCVVSYWIKAKSKYIHHCIVCCRGKIYCFPFSFSLTSLSYIYSQKNIKKIDIEKKKFM